MEKGKIKLTSEAIARLKDKLICVAMDINIVYTIDLKSGDIDLLYCIPEEDLFCARLVGAITVCGEKTIFIPYHAKKVWIYDNMNGEWKGIQLNHESCKAKFWNVHLHEKNIYMIPSKYPAIVRMNIDTYEIDEFTDCVTPNSNRQADYGYFFSNFVSENENLYLASCLDNHILTLHMQDMKYKWKEIGKKHNKYVGMTKAGGKIWLAPRRNTAIVEWDMEKDQTAEYNLPCQFIDEYNFLGISNRGNLYLPGIRDGKTLVFNIENHSIRQEHNLAGHTFSDWLDGNIYVRYFYDGKVLIEDSGSQKEYYILVSKNLMNDFILKAGVDAILREKVLIENNLCDLQTFLKIIGR